MTQAEQAGRAKRYEEFVTWYLRFNGYFTVPNFIVHAGDDATRISDGHVGNRTEVDVLAVRFPFSSESSGILFPTDGLLVSRRDRKLDVLIVEVKSGDTSSPNELWQDENRICDIEYILRYIGPYQNSDLIRKAATKLYFTHSFSKRKIRIRYIVFSKKINREWHNRGVQYIEISDCIKFFIRERGRCWCSSGIGHQSIHQQWSELVKKILSVTNQQEIGEVEKERQIWSILND